MVRGESSSCGRVLRDERKSVTIMYPARLTTGSTRGGVVPAPERVNNVLTRRASDDYDSALDLACRLGFGLQEPTNFPSSASRADGLAWGVVLVVDILGEGSIPCYSSSPL